MSSINPSQQHSSAIPTGGEIPPPIGESTTQSKPSNPFAAPTNTAVGEKPTGGAAAASSGATTTRSHSAVAYLLTWQDPVYTGKVFGSIVSTLVIFHTINLVNIFFHVAYIALLLSAAAEYAGKLLTGRGFVTNYFKNFTTNSSYATKFNKQVLPSIADLNVEVEKTINQIIFAQDIETTLKAAGVSYILYKVTSYVSFFNLFVFGLVFVFTVPYFYKTYQKEIDAAVGKYTACAKSRFAKLTDEAQQKAGPVVDDLIKKLGPVGEFIQSKIPVRTAGSTVGNSKATSYGNAADDHIASSSGVSSGATTSTTVPIHKSDFPKVPKHDDFDDDTDDFADTTQEHKY
ncbi:uncharacterized protein LODBEIA_P52690 [Lodderomyces beijingensis]|uniref:Reticulon-like protein n=1 Tax=Lodderomyces beijingensis TaxID=1775926 RepID=A0ABP0ZV13_9ASCO